MRRAEAVPANGARAARVSVERSADGRVVLTLSGPLDVETAAAARRVVVENVGARVARPP